MTKSEECFHKIGKVMGDARITSEDGLNIIANLLHSTLDNSTDDSNTHIFLLTEVHNQLIKFWSNKYMKKDRQEVDEVMEEVEVKNVH
jgi:hypothetical protein